MKRCEWVGDADEQMLAYHDEEWGVPSHDDRYLFEMLTLEGAQAGLSWATILRKRTGYRAAFAGFDPVEVARFDAGKVESLLTDPGIVRNRLKVESTVNNAARVLELQQEFGSFAAFVWDFVDGEPLVGGWKTLSELPAETAISKRMSKELKRRGFRFVGPTVCYSFMQAAGLVDDHVRSCYRYGHRRGLGLRLTILAALAVAVAAPAAAAAAPAPGTTIERAVESAAGAGVAETFVRVYDPLPAEAGAHPPACDWITYLRFRDPDGPRRASAADAVAVIIPGFLGGAGSFDQLARNTVASAAAEGRFVEFWALDRRSNCLEDHTGVQAAARRGTASTAYNY
jgi:DNA-3-methyladenine glycosylase I